MRRLVLAVSLLIATASGAHATGVDFRTGIRSFGPDHERYPEVGLALQLGPERWRLRPVIGAAVALEPLYGGSVTEGDVGLAGDFPHRGRSAWSWGLGIARLRYDFGANQGDADAGWGELAWRWVRPAAVDFGVSLRYLDGADIRLRYERDPGDAGFAESISTFVLSFLMHW